MRHTAGTIFVMGVMAAVFAQSVGVRAPQVLFTQPVGANGLGVVIPADERSLPAGVSAPPAAGTGDKDAGLRRNGPAALGVDARGNIVIVDTVNRKTKVFTRGGRLISQSQTSLTDLSALCVYKSGRYGVVSGALRNTVTMFDGAGRGLWQVTAGTLVDSIYPLPQNHLLIVFADVLRPSLVLNAKGRAISNGSDKPLTLPYRYAGEGGSLYRVAARGAEDTLRFEIETARIQIGAGLPPVSVTTGATITLPARTPVLKRIALRFRGLLIGGDGALYLAGSESVTRQTENDTPFLLIAALKSNGTLRDEFSLPDDPFGSVANLAVDSASRLHTLEYVPGKRALVRVVARQVAGGL